LTHFLPVAEYGLYALTIVVAEMADMTCSSWIRLAQLRLDTPQPESLRCATLRSLRLTVAAVLAGVFGAIMVSRLLVPARSLAFALAVGSYVVANGFLRLGLTVLRLRGKAVAYSALETGRAIGICAGALAAVEFVSRSFLAASLATSCTTAIFGILAYLFCLRGTTDTQSGAAGYRERLRYGAPIVLLMVITYLFTSSDRLLLQVLGSPAALGIYAAAFALAKQPIEAVANAVNQGSFPELIQRYEAGGAGLAAEFLGQTLVFLVALVLPLIVLLIAFAGPLVHALLPHAYREIGPAIVPYIAIGTLCLYVKSFVLDQVFYVVRKNWIQVATFLPAAVAAVAANVLLIPRFGAIGAAQAMCLANFVGLITSFVVSARYIRPVISMRLLSLRAASIFR
ncbi:MAG TPA: lipopolysaccharide biosynthesis protein, partial [Rhizomicrobium sp.]